MSDAKYRLRSIPRGLLGAYLPNWVLLEPFPEMLAKWDELLQSGQKVVAIGNSDAHAWPISLGPLTRVIYPYEFLFKTVNTHLLLSEPLAQDVSLARQQIFGALKAGHCYVSNDLVASPKGFAFTAHSGRQTAMMGDSLYLQKTASLQVTSPQRARLTLLKNGQVIARSNDNTLTVQISEPGVYRVEAHRWFWGATRGWVYTNPIYVELATG
jgi:hypothetical protein